MTASMPPLLYGTAWKKESTAPLVAVALREGFLGIDTACQPKHYHEPGVGEGIAMAMKAGLRRDDLFLQSKFTPLAGQDPLRVPYDPRASLGRQVAQSCEISLQNLQTTYLDSLVLHSPLPAMSATLEVWRAMEDLVDTGRVRCIGISNCYELKVLRRLFDSARIAPAVVQNRFYAQSGYDVGIRAFCRENRVVYQSFWTLTANTQLLASEPIASIAGRTRGTPAQVLFRYLNQEGVVPLTGTRSIAHMREDLAMLDFELTVAEREAITAQLQ